MIGALILAAGRSVRFGSDKRMARLGPGNTLLQATIDLYLAHFDRVVLVLRPEDVAEQMLGETDCERLTIVRPPSSRLGLGDSIAAGIAGCQDWSCACIALADMPWIRPGTLAALLAEWRTAGPEEQTVLYPTYENAIGHPVFFHASLFPALRSMEGDRGAASVRTAAARKLAVRVSDEGVIRDVDRPADLG